MTVTLKGTPDEVREHLGSAPEEDTPPGAPTPGVPEGPPPQKAAYIEALKDPKNTVIVKRISPRRWNEQAVNLEVYREQCPLVPSGIEDEVRAEFGGRKYRSAVISTETGQVIAADTFEVDGDPIVKRTEEEERIERMMMEQGAPPPVDMNEAMLERQTRLTAKQTEYEMARQQLESLKNQQAGGKTDPRLDARIRELEQRTFEQQADRRIAEVEARHRQELDDLKRQIAAQSHQKPQGLEDPLIKMMMEQNKQANDRFEKLLTQMNDNRMADIQRQIAEVKSKPAGNNLLEMADSMLKLKEVFGWGGGEGDDDDDEEDGEGKPFLERLADKYLPKVFEMIEDEQSKSGKELSKDEVVARINAAADQAVKEELIRRREVAQQQQRALPAPQPAPAPAPQAAAPAPAPAAPPQRQIPSIEEEVKIRVASVMAVLERELILRPRGWQWTLAAWQALPEDLREKLCAAGLAPVAAISVFDGVVTQEGLESLKVRLGTDPKASAWFERGLAELRGWAEELAKDPDFDPTEEAEEEDEA